jgi:hypothetical protein
MPASDQLLTAFKTFYAETVRPDLEGVVRSSERRVRKQLRREVRTTAEGLRAEGRESADGLRSEMRETADGLRGEMREMEGRLRFEIREGDEHVRHTFEQTLEELRRDVNGHFDAVHQRLGHLETEYRMLIVGLRRLEDVQSQGPSE